MQTLNTFFNTQYGSPEWAANITKSQKFARAKQLISQQLMGFQPPADFDERLIKELCKALDIDFGHILVWGWRKRREIVQYRDKANPAGHPHQVTLCEYTLVSKHCPTFQPVINEVPLPVKFEFDVTLKLHINGGMLMIQDGKIMEIRTGTCTGNGLIEIAGFTIIEKKTAPFRLPGTIEFEEGIPI